MKVVAKALASVAFMAVAGMGVTACTEESTDQGYMQVWESGHYTYVPYSYYTQHKSYYSNPLHPAHRRSSNYVTTHHVTVTHKSTTTVNKDGSRTTKRTTTRTTTRNNSKRR